MQVGVEESLSCLYLSFPAAVGPLLLHSGPVSAAMARALLLLFAQGRKEKGRCVLEWNWMGSRTFVLTESCLLLPKAVLACINISSMRQMFFQMQELPQLWHVSRVDFVRNGTTPGCRPPSTPRFCRVLKLTILSSLIRATSNIQTSYMHGGKGRVGCESIMPECLFGHLLGVVLKTELRTS